MPSPLNKVIAGVDEAGRGPLAGPVIAAAVILDQTKPIAGLTDSKKLTTNKLDYFYTRITTEALAIGVGRAEAEEIDDINILQASLLAMSRALDNLTISPTEVLVDGNFCPKSNYPCQAIIKGDSLITEISAASVIAKVTRDKEMVKLAESYPQYGFERHKGYPTKNHLLTLKKHGISPIHRKTFAPVANIIMEMAKT